MDALGGYGSSDSSDNDSGDDKPKSALSGLLVNLSDASDDDEDNAHAAAAAAAPTDATTDNDGNEANEPPQKKMRRGGEELDSTYHDSISRPQYHVLPPPKVLASTNNTDDFNTETAPFQSLILSTKDYTSQLRQTLTQQLQSQASERPTQQKRLADKLKLLQETFQKNDNSAHQSTSSSSNMTSSSSFAAHLKSKQEFGNPHLLKDIIDHFQITALDSKQFKPFEFFDRLQISEEKARIAAANYGAGNLS